MADKIDIQYFNQFSEGYSPYSVRDIKEITKSLIQYIDKKRENNIAEIGCGAGQFSNELKLSLYGSNIFYGIDIAEKLLKNYPFNRLHASAFEIPVEDTCFDFTCYPASLHHLYPFEKALQEMNRILKPGGYFYCLEPNLFHPHRLLLMNFPKIYQLKKKIDDVPINPCKLKRDITMMGFKVVYFKFLNIDFKSPGQLQKIQNVLSSSFLAKFSSKIVMPWFILIAKKK